MTKWQLGTWSPRPLQEVWGEKAVDQTLGGGGSSSAREVRPRPAVTEDSAFPAPPPPPPRRVCEHRRQADSSRTMTQLNPPAERKRGLQWRRGHANA